MDVNKKSNRFEKRSIWCVTFFRVGKQDIYIKNMMMIFVFTSQADEPVEQPQQLLHAAPAPKLRPGIGVLAQLDQHPGDAPQQLQVVGVQQAQQHRQALQLPQLIPDLPHR